MKAKRGVRPLLQMTCEKVIPGLGCSGTQPRHAHERPREEGLDAGDGDSLRRMCLEREPQFFRGGFFLGGSGAVEGFWGGTKCTVCGAVSFFYNSIVSPAACIIPATPTTG